MYTPPFKYDKETQIVFDANNIPLCLMRGWSYLSSKLPGKEACEIQDKNGEWIANCLNRSVKISPEMPELFESKEPKV